MEKLVKQPNVVVFFTDQQRWDTTGIHGNPLDLTPNFDRLAKEGTHVRYSFTCQPVCGPARSALQSGLYPTTTGCYTNGNPLPVGTMTLAHHFKNAGYKTGYIGKWHLAGEEPVTEEHRGGYEYWLASDLLEFTSDAYQTTVYDNNNQAVHLPGYRVDALMDASIRFIDKEKDHPFFLFTSYLEPHHQNHIDDYPAPDGYREKYAGKWMPPDLTAGGGSAYRHIDGYFGMVKRLDEALGRLVDALKSLDLYENTIILFTSDHGNHFKTRNAEYKRSGHDNSIRTPCMLHGPGFQGGGQIDRLVSLIDLPPTLLDAAGIPVPQEMQGDSILPLIHTKESDWKEEVYIQISESQVGRAVRTKRWKYIVHAPQKDAWKNDHSDVYDELFLYDLYSDPYEQVNLIEMASHKKVAEVMCERLQKCMRKAGEKPAVIRTAGSVDSGQRIVSEAEAYQ